MTRLTPPPRHAVRDVLDRAFREDLAEAGDLTTDALIEPDARTTGRIVARAGGTISGLDIAAEAFSRLDPDVEMARSAGDGDTVAPMTRIASLDGSTRALLTAERTALNILGHLSGIATMTRSIVDAIDGTACRVADTRKTTPGLRALEKYAVRCGGGMNHRLGLHDAVMIKDNHLAVSESITDAIDRARVTVGHTVTIEVEVDRLDQIGEAVEAGADIILLDNMSPDDLRAAVEQIRGRAVTEASGGITPDTAAEIATTGVDIISVGWITHSAPCLDVALDVDVW